MFNTPFSMVVAIVFIACFTGLARHWIDSRNRYAAERDNTLDDGVQDRVGRLEHRIEVLEAIVTDRGYDLKREIDRL